MEVKIKRRKYNKKIQEDVLNMLKISKSIPELSKKLGVADQVLYRWKK